MKSLIKFIMGIKTDEQGIKEPVYSHMKVNDGHVRYYDDATYALSAIQGCPRLLIEYLAKQMDGDNIVKLTSYEKEAFNKDVQKYIPDSTGYSKIMIEKSLAKLKENDILIPVQRGVYMVNPIYFFKGKSESKRHKLIRKKLEMGANIKT